MGEPDHFEEINERLEESKDNFRPYAIDTAEHSPDINDYIRGLDNAYRSLKSEEDMEEFSVVTHSLSGPAALKWVHENDFYSEIDKFVASAGPFKGVAAADLARKVDQPANMLELYTKAVTAFNPVIGSRDIEEHFEKYKLDAISDDFVSRRSAEEGELAQLMDETEITDRAEVHTIRSSIDRWYGPLENILPLGYESLASLVSRENRLDSPAIEGADGNLVLPSSTHHDAIEGEMAVEYTARVLEEHSTELELGT